MMKNNTMYTSTDSLIYNNTLLVYPDSLEETINVTCTAMIRGINYSQSEMLHRMNVIINHPLIKFLEPSSPLINVKGYILNATSIKVNWTNSSENDQYVIEYIKTGGVTRNVLSTSENEIMLTDLSPMSTYTFMVYSYEDIISVNNSLTLLKFDSKLSCMFVLYIYIHVHLHVCQFLTLCIFYSS